MTQMHASNVGDMLSVGEFLRSMGVNRQKPEPEICTVRLTIQINAWLSWHTAVVAGFFF